MNKKIRSLFLSLFFVSTIMTPTITKPLFSNFIAATVGLAAACVADAHLNQQASAPFELVRWGSSIFGPFPVCGMTGVKLVFNCVEAKYPLAMRELAYIGAFAVTRSLLK